MATFKVSVEKEYTVKGHIEVEAESAVEALQAVEAQMKHRSLQTCDPGIQWEEPEYVDFSFQATGEVDGELH